MPDLGEGLTEGEIVQWLVAVGDEVTVDQPIAELSTEKALVQVPTPFAGRVATLHGSPGELVAVGRPLITIEVQSEAAEQAKEQATESEPAPASASGNVLVGYGTNEAPATRRRRVTRADLERASADRVASAGPAVTMDGERARLTGVHRVAAERLTRSHRDAPVATAWVTADATQLVAARDRLDTSAGDTKVTPFAVLLRLCVAALQRYPRLNAHFDAQTNEVVTFNAIHLGVAVQTDRGLVVPVIRDAQQKSAPVIAAELRRLAEHARDRTLDAAELTGSTFTVSNFGAFGVDGGTAIINPPEAAILGVGHIVERPWVVDGAVASRKVVQVSLIFDHRVADGALAGGFVRHLADLIEDPELALRDE